GTGSNWDGNQDPTTGYPCLDDPARGPGDLLTGDFPNVTNSATGCTSSQPCAWPRQPLEPLYEWLNTTNAQFGPYVGFSGTPLQYDRDMFAYAGGVGNGSSGVGAGTFAQRPGCTLVNAGYWATDTRTLYRCATVPNGWVLHYQPYQYPH